MTSYSLISFYHGRTYIDRIQQYNIRNFLISPKDSSIVTCIFSKMLFKVFKFLYTSKLDIIRLTEFYYHYVAFFLFTNIFTNLLLFVVDV